MSVRREFDRDGEKFAVAAEKRGDEVVVQLDGRSLPAQVRRLHDGRIQFELDGVSHRAQVVRAKDAILVRLDGHTWRLPMHRGRRGGGGEASGDVTAPMTGTVLDVRVQVGDQVEKGDTVAVVTAMKMEHKLTAALDGTVTEVGAAANDQVDQGALIVRIEGAEESLD